nr:hypothetical protein [bacterium]
MKRRLIILLLALVAVVAACGDDDDDNNDFTDDDPTDDDADDDDADDDDDVIDDDTTDDDTIDDDTADDDTTDDDTLDDDTTDDDTGDDDFAPPSPAYGYYQEGSSGNWTWLEAQLPSLAADDLILFLGMDDVSVGDPGLLHLLQEAKTQGVEIRAWVLLPYSSGYWPGEQNAADFAVSALAFADWFIQEDVGIEWIVVDMEMDHGLIAQLNNLFAEGKYLEAAMLLLGNYTPERFAQASAIYQQMVEDLAELGFYSMVVTYPQILDDLADADTFLQDVMEVPVSTVGWHEVSTMPYTTTFENMLGMPFGPYLIYDYARSTVEYFGDAASIALGISGEMDDPARLAAEVAASKAAGVERIQVYNLGG